MTEMMMEVFVKWLCQSWLPMIPGFYFYPKSFAEFSSVFSLIPGKLHTWKASDLLYCIVCVQIDKELQISPVFLPTWVANWSWQFPTFRAWVTPPIRSLTWIKRSRKHNMSSLLWILEGWHRRLLMSVVFLGSHSQEVSTGQPLTLVHGTWDTVQGGELERKGNLKLWPLTELDVSWYYWKIIPLVVSVIKTCVVCVQTVRPGDDVTGR